MSRDTKGRKALIRSLVNAIVEHERIVTTRARAKLLKPVIDKLINKAKKQTLSARRQIISSVAGNKKIADKIFNDLALRFVGINSGYTTLIKLPPRKTDKAEMALVEFIKPNIKIKKAAKVKKVSRVGKNKVDDKTGISKSKGKTAQSGKSPAKDSNLKQNSENNGKRNQSKT
ncbi:MAG: 50S ribosomal protein L17 [Nitrososphaerota archaeon]